MDVVNIKQKLSQFDEYWSPKIVGELNDDKVQEDKTLTAEEEAI